MPDGSSTTVSSATPPVPSTPAEVDADPTPSLRRRRNDLLLLVLLVVVVALPLVVAAGVLHEPRWYPANDDAQTELKVRDVGSSNPPLTGLGGRIGEFGPDGGSHPGPLSFWSLAIVYRVLGAGAWTLNASTAVLNIIAMGLTLWMARRRGGTPVMVAAAVLLIVLTTAYGTYALTLPWNPYLPILWWVTAMVAAWSLLCGDLPTLPVAVFATSFCLQTHISYVGLGSVLALIGVAAAGYWVYDRRRDRDALRSSLRWVAVGTALGALLWFPPIAEQITGSQGHNLSTIYDHFGSPSEEPLGLVEGAEVLLSAFDPWALLTEPAIDGRFFLGGSTLPGLVLVAAWVATVGLAWRMRHLTLLRLHALLAVVVVGGLVSASRIFGPPFRYLALWGWGIATLLLLAVGWTAAAWGARRAGGPDRGPARSRLAPAGAAAVALVVLALTTRATVDAAHTEVFHPELTRSAAEIVPETVAALSEGSLPGTGRDGRYSLTWNDPWHGGARGFSLLNELDREGFDVGANRFFRSAFGRHRVLEPSEATARIHVSVGPDIDVWAAKPGTHRIAYHDPATAEARAEYERLRFAVIEELDATGASDLDPLVDNDPYAFRFNGALSEAGRARIERMIELGRPVAVFVAPPDVDG
ncbi:hypothetical protein [Iamia sp.]|uniref:hypothetical protein n=1 Tax=Iamia sp. TaxID=2722710 RepID=UPI002C8BFCF8|nr:hypothetical protein [Iamia sp.]HXH55688.1 hypothetical protein [Iamia sp.]